MKEGLGKWELKAYGNGARSLHLKGRTHGQLSTMCLYVKTCPSCMWLWLPSAAFLPPIKGLTLT